MYDKIAIQNTMLGLVGIRQTNNPDFNALNASILKNSTNKLLSHPLITVENLDQTMEQSDLFVYPNYVAATSYSIGNKVTSVVDSNRYRSLVNNNLGNEPSVSPTEWEPLNLLSEMLEDLFRESIDTTIGDIFRMKKLRNEVKDVMESRRIFEGAGRLTDKIIASGRLVGFEIVLKRHENIKLVMERIGLQVDTVQAALTILIYHTSQATPIATIAIAGTKAISFEWFVPSSVVEMFYLNDNYDAGGRFFVMYDEDDLAGQAIQKTMDFSRSPCYHCSGYNLDTWNMYNLFFNLATVSVKSTDRVDADGTPNVAGIGLWDINNTQYHTNTNFGLNFDFSLKCDLTDFLTKHKDVFTDAVAAQITVDLITHMSNSTRQNNLTEKVMAKARFALQAEGVGGEGLLKMLEKVKQSTDFDISDLKSSCMPCNDRIRKGVTRYSSIGV